MTVLPRRDAPMDAASPHPLAGGVHPGAHAIRAQLPADDVEECVIGGCRSPRLKGSWTHFYAPHDETYRTRLYEMTHDVGRGAL